VLRAQRTARRLVALAMLKVSHQRTMTRKTRFFLRFAGRFADQNET